MALWSRSQQSHSGSGVMSPFSRRGGRRVKTRHGPPRRAVGEARLEHAVVEVTTRYVGAAQAGNPRVTRYPTVGNGRKWEMQVEFASARDYRFWAESVRATVAAVTRDQERGPVHAAPTGPVRHKPHIPPVGSEIAGAPPTRTSWCSCHSAILAPWWPWRQVCAIVALACQ